jgi:D-arginine dehydrogenase
MEKVGILIIGGGVVGLSMACHLARRGQGSRTLLLEREDLPGFYASGHNAGIARQLTGVPEHTTLARAGRDLLLRAGLLEPTGGILLGAEAGGTDALAQEAARFELPVEKLPGAPWAGLGAAEHLRIPSDGLIDTSGLLDHCTRGAREGGVRVRHGCEAISIRPLASGFEVVTDGGTLQAEELVNAAGAWAGSIGRQAGGLDIPFQPLRRHLIWSAAPCAGLAAWVWWADRGLYLRPESGGTLLCACEEDLQDPPPRGRQSDTDPRVLEPLYERLKELAPALLGLPITRLWCGLRTFAPDRRFLIGRDPRNPRLFWVAGLGGHGMTTGLAVGDLAARTFLGEAPEGRLGPGRFSPRA